MSCSAVAFVPHPPASASGRYRVYQMAPALEQHGVRLDVRPFLDERAFQRLYLPGQAMGKAMDLAAGARRRWSDLDAVSDYDVALVHREIWPIVGQAAERRLAARQPRCVFDFDDAVFMKNVSEANSRFAFLKPFDQPQRLVAAATRVAAGNAWLAEWARKQRAGATDDAVSVVPSAVDTTLWTPAARPPADPLRLVWIGSPSTARYLDPLAPAFARLSRRFSGLQVHVIGAEWSAPDVNVIHHAWSADTERDLVRAAHVGLAPLEDTDWARGKCGLKLLLYMACGLPSVASPVGVHSDIVQHGENGLLAADSEAFEESIDRVLSDATLRASMATAARRIVEERFSVEAVAPKLASLLLDAAGRN